MRLEDYERIGAIVKVTPDKKKAESLLKQSKNNLLAVSMIEINDITAGTVISTSYESLRQVIEAICLMEGYKVYSHEAYTAYLLRLDEKMARMFDRLRYLRNQVNYYGKNMSATAAKEALRDVRKLIGKLKKHNNL